MTKKYLPREIEHLASEVIRRGYCILPRHFSVEVLRYWNDTFAPILADHIEREGHLRNRGPGRYYVTLPFAVPWMESAFFEDEDLLSVIDRLVGPEPVMCQLATDTPVLGSDYQEVHRDTPPLFPETGTETPPFQLAVNFPLVDVNQENGPMEIAAGTHLLPKAIALEGLQNGKLKLEPVPMRLGDVMIRDVRALHRGTPNRTAMPRPMVVIGFSRRWLFRPEVSIRIPVNTYERLSDRARQLLRFNPRVQSLDEALPSTEIYQAFAY